MGNVAMSVLTTGALQDQSPQGNIYFANASSQLGISSSDIVLISCDPYTGNYQPKDVVNTAEQQQATAVLLYSEKGDSCAIDNDATTYKPIYSVNLLNETEALLKEIGTLDSPYATIGARDRLQQAQGGSNNNNDQSSNSNLNPTGPSPSTAVAMIILYSITGVITALFLIIIITGAVRAHRHPERYGPRNGVGRPRQSRARGLARAMLDTIPIVKFGDREADHPKPTDVELAEGSSRSVEVLTDPNQASDSTNTKPATNQVPQTSGPNVAHDEGIAAASNDERSNPPPETQGCSICTEDFEMGQDQRVLPCDHRFHPECIDPWLLNVSGTCPLCRIDLRPHNSRTSVDELGNPLPAEDPATDLAPPLDGRMGVRRSIIIGLMGIRPERMTREQRLSALRQYRERRGEDQGADGGEEESSTRRRLRNAFRIRTRRTGGVDEDGSAEQQAEGAAAPQQNLNRSSWMG